MSPEASKPHAGAASRPKSLRTVLAALAALLVLSLPLSLWGELPVQVALALKYAENPAAAQWIQYGLRSQGLLNHLLLASALGGIWAGLGWRWFGARAAWVLLLVFGGLQMPLLLIALADSAPRLVVLRLLLSLGLVLGSCALYRQDISRWLRDRAEA